MKDEDVVINEQKNCLQITELMTKNINQADQNINSRSKRNIAKRNYEELVNPKSWTNPSKELGYNSAAQKNKSSTLNMKKKIIKQSDVKILDEKKISKKSNTESIKKKIYPVKKETKVKEVNTLGNNNTKKNYKKATKVNIFSSFEFCDSRTQDKGTFTGLDTKHFEGSTINYYNNFNINFNGIFDSEFSESLKKIQVNNPIANPIEHIKPKPLFGKKRKIQSLHNASYSQETNILKESLTRKINSKLMQSINLSCEGNKTMSNDEINLNEKMNDDEKPTVNLKLASELKKKKISFKVENNSREKAIVCNSGEKLKSDKKEKKTSEHSLLSESSIDKEEYFSKSLDDNKNENNEGNLEKNQEVNDSSNENDKSQSIQRVKFFKGRRRSKKQESGRIFKCECGKSYLSETALNNHKITKHKYHSEKRSKGRPKKADVFIDGISFEKYNTVFTSNPFRSIKKISVIEVVYDNPSVLDIYINSIEKIALSSKAFNSNEVIKSFYSNMKSNSRSHSYKTNSSESGLEKYKDKEYDSLIYKNEEVENQTKKLFDIKISLNEFILEKNLNIIFQRVYILKKIWLSTIFNNFYSKIKYFEDIDVNKYDENPLFKGLLRNMIIVEDADLVAELKDKYELNMIKSNSNNLRKKSQFNLCSIHDEAIEKKLLDQLLAYKVEFQVKDSKEELDEFNKKQQNQNEILKENKIDNCLIKYLCFMGNQTNLGYFNYLVMVFVLFREYLINVNKKIMHEKEKQKEMTCNNFKSDMSYKRKNEYGSINFGLDIQHNDLNLFNNLETIKRESDEECKLKKSDEKEETNDLYRRDRSLSCRRITFPVILVESSIEEYNALNPIYHKPSEDIYNFSNNDAIMNYYDNYNNLRKNTNNNEYSDIKNNNNSTMKRRTSEISSTERKFSFCNLKYLDILDEINNKELFKSNIENDELLDFNPQELFCHYELFITEYLEPNNFFNIYDPEEIVQIIAHFTYWLNSYGYTKFRVGIVNI